ncbi:PEP-CTERM sorting domain-containing protein [Alteromonas sp. C1M14]|uniref:PEP-CTERM sorting domain-containing protein n=1 Tax=Alteromonas sp. C1M14 TaxID=2841567 RepID=UPI001C08BAE8|nr:PEP-CTERM sorting domain-containing protein [Alteromonas sp. C1M14]MBU2978037.1 hypothetical protein [Alteromonas sp. C1M14]
MKFSMKAATLLATFCAFIAQADIINTYDIDFENQTLTAHGQNDGSYSTWDNGGSVLNLQENSWFVLNLEDAFGIESLDLNSADSQFELSFDFRMQATGNDPLAYSEIAGIWLADFTKGEQDHDASRTFSLAGTQGFGLDDFSYTDDSQWQSFSFTLDDYLSGLVTDIVFINDCDASNGCNDMTVRFRNASISEVSEPTAMSLILLGVGFMGWRARRQK